MIPFDALGHVALPRHRVLSWDGGTPIPDWLITHADAGGTITTTPGRHTTLTGAAANGDRVSVAFPAISTEDCEAVALRVILAAAGQSGDVHLSLAGPNAGAVWGRASSGDGTTITTYNAGGATTLDAYPRYVQAGTRVEHTLLLGTRDGDVYMLTGDQPTDYLPAGAAMDLGTITPALDLVTLTGTPVLHIMQLTLERWH